ncbi:hypothetical protein Lfu02_79610 [Longispora fulva]|uniref:Uncharacterized protein n=1 Tax=Longispora fulva TaxID=619741 RepID=A0A8J7KFP3_9ACTN|nr:hypothetical protein [Longispora fulva]MBG6133984.1 hypothetical protein [Longispora fulva]GIG63589.1 hypothetical protein Lfu02_79610 [Longispora fulva]
MNNIRLATGASQLLTGTSRVANRALSWAPQADAATQQVLVGLGAVRAICQKLSAHHPDPDGRTAAADADRLLGGLVDEVVSTRRTLRARRIAVQWVVASVCWVLAPDGDMAGGAQ